MSNIDTFFANVKLPSIPDLAHALIKSLNDPNVSREEVCDLISRDPAISDKLLRLANSAQFGLPRGVGTVAQLPADVLDRLGLERAWMQKRFPDNADFIDAS